jgi:hypothetical protein
MRELVIVADLGCLKGYVVRQDLGDPSPVIDLVADTDLGRDYVHFTGRDEDAAGRFSQGGMAGQPGGMSYGERHEESERARQVQMEKLAGAIRTLCDSQTDCERVHVAAPQVIHDRLLDLAGEPVRRRLGKTLPLDLIHATKMDLLERFGYR